MIFTHDSLVDLLRNNVVKVTFTKVDGSERVMSCTLMAEYVPNAPTNNGQVLLQESKSSSTISVWDTESNGWRSFRIASVKSVSVG